MIIPESEKSESSRHTTRSSFDASDAPPSPPPYSPTVASGNESYGRTSSPRGFAVPSGSTPNPNAPPAPRPNLPPRSNYLIERKTYNSISGTWYVDTGLPIPERLLPPITEFDGSWNKEIQRLRREREREKRWRDWTWLSNSGASPLPPLVEVRPNLMLATTCASISGQIHVLSSDGVIRPTTIVAEGSNGTVSLKIHAAPDQPLRVFADSTNGSVTVRVPPSFEGAVVMSTTWGSVKISDAIKTKLTTFSATSNSTSGFFSDWRASRGDTLGDQVRAKIAACSATCSTTRGFIGDWKASGFGLTPDTSSDPNDDPPLPTTQPSPDPFDSWTGPLIHITSTNATVSLTYNDEDMLSELGNEVSKAFRGLVNSFFGGNGGDDGHDNALPSSRPPPSPNHSSPGPGNHGYPQDIKHPIPGSTSDFN